VARRDGKRTLEEWRGLLRRTKIPESRLFQTFTGERERENIVLNSAWFWKASRELEARLYSKRRKGEAAESP
jgi:hypothetical protein